MIQNKIKPKQLIIFGPVPSRRLGYSLGINIIPPKNCTYSCAYCQLGRTVKTKITRQGFYEPKDILQAVQVKLRQAIKMEAKINYLTFVADGEPTLDINLEQEIKLLKPFGIPVAVITNSSLIYQPQVRQALLQADLVSLKFDAVEQTLWRKINHPNQELDLVSILKGSLEFAKIFRGKLITETMLLSGINDTAQSIKKVANFLAKLNPDTAYLATPIRPPAEKWAKPVCEEVIVKAYQLFKEKIKHVECLTAYEGNLFVPTGNIEDDLLSITAVHPLRDDALDIFLKRLAVNRLIVRRLILSGQLVETEYRGHKFYLKKF